MSFLFKFLDSGLLLTLGLILLISGGIMLYCYRRLNLLEKSVIEHGKILHNFILNYNVQMQNLSILNKSSLDETKNDVSETKKINLEEKIAVSDNETDDESDNETDDESENESCSDEKHDTANESSDESDTESDNESIHNGITISENKLVEDISNLTDLTDLTNLEELTDLTNLDKPIVLNSDEESFMQNLPISLDSFKMDLTNGSKIIILENLDEPNEPNVGNKKSYSKMKVDDLKSLVVTKNILDNDSAQKMKKSDLIKMLQNNK